MSKFKKGDRVVLAHPDSFSIKEEHPMGRAGTIISIKNEVVASVNLDHTKEEYCWLYVKELEYEHIYNSPLYKALS